MPNSVFDRLGYNFDSVNFEGAEQISEAGLTTLEQTKTKLTTWQYDQIARDDTAATNYFRNPTANLYISLRNTANSLNILATNLSLSNIATQANNFVLELDRFKSHTDNISGVISMTDGREITFNIPQYQIAISAAEQVVNLLYSADGVANTVGALGSFTSLFINAQLTSNNTLLAADLVSLNSSVVSVGLPVTQQSNLGGVALEAINTRIVIANTMIATRRNHDWNFFKKSLDIMSDMGMVSQFNRMGKLKTELIRNKIGTDALLANLQAPVIHNSNTGVFDSSSINIVSTTANSANVNAAVSNRANLAIANYYATETQEETIPDFGESVGSQTQIVREALEVVRSLNQNTSGTVFLDVTGVLTPPSQNT